MRRVLLGDRSSFPAGGGYDLWVSKPGNDVTTAGPGQLLLGGGVGIYQIIASGSALLRSGNVNGPQTYLIDLPSEVPAVADLFCIGQVYHTSGGNVNYSNRYMTNSINHASFRVLSTRQLQVRHFLNLTFSGINLYCDWAIFNGKI